MQKGSCYLFGTGEAPLVLGSLGDGPPVRTASVGRVVAELVLVAALAVGAAGVRLAVRAAAEPAIGIILNY